MTSDSDWIPMALEPATLLSVTENNGMVTRVYVTPCKEPSKKKPLAERKTEVFPEENKSLFTCPYCGNGIRTAGAFKVHLKACEKRFETMGIHGTGTPQLHCSICKKTFSTVSSLSSHRLVHGSGPVKRRCAACKINFETELEYRTHLESHLKERKSKDESDDDEYTVSKFFQCLFCRKGFLACFKPGQVSRRYACDDCIKNLKVQEENQKKTVPVKKTPTFCCDRCGRLYRYEGFLNRHLKICHEPIAKKKQKLENKETN
ncbi:zinc finger protein 317 [Drosophila eugracilis]|uniref:zinc finger protein 317 n=1 Tax=Drosophila eugracilis TaxID=29029 RepID=UPI0007E641E1|nr:zinc finger protein 317 [Drosophila eugracilis]